MDSEPSEDFGSKIPEKKTAQENSRPDFLATTDKLKKQDAAMQGLGAAEKSAVNNDKAKDDQKGGVLDAKNAENRTGLYTGGGKMALAKNAAKGKFSIKKSGAILAITFVLFIAGGIASLTQIFQPFDLLAQFKDTFNSMHTSVNKRSDRFFKAQMETGRTKNPLKGSKIFGQKFKISKKQQKKLKEKGIEYDEKTFEADGKKIKVLKYEDDSGNIKVVGADEKAVKSLNSLDLSKFDTGVEGVKFDAEAISFKNFYATNTKFFTAYNAGSMTWRGKIGNWYGKNTKNFLKKNNLTRNRFEDWKKKLKEAGGENDSSVAKKLFKKIMGEGTDKINGGGIKNTDKENDDNGEKLNSKEEPFEDLDRQDLTEAKIKSRLDEISGKFNKAANIGCAAIGVIGAINLLVQASEMLQILNLTTSSFETVDKTEYGLGDDAPINELANSLNERKENKHEVVKGEATGKIVDGKISGLYTETESTYKTAIESKGVAALYDNTRVDPKDPSVASFNIMANSKKILGGLGEGMTSYEGCLVAKAGAAAISAVADGFEIAACIAGLLGAPFTFGGSTVACGPLAIGIASSVALGMSISVILGALVTFVTPIAVNALTRDLISDLGGEDLGNALTSGANIYQGGAHRASGGSLSSIDKYKDFAVNQQQVIAENDKYERETLSPFDITSGNTFMGSILRQISGFNSASSLITTITAGESIVSSSVMAMLPTASAANITKTLPDSMDDYAEVNPYLASIGAVGDSYGNSYVMTDVSTIEKDPADVITSIDNTGKGAKRANLSDSEASDGNVIINDDSNLAKYIRYCSERSSPFGVADQNIANEFVSGDVDTGNNVISNAINGAIGAVPVIGDVLDIIQDSEQLANIGWISGESCVAGNTVNATASPDWSETKNYQRFVEDQSLAESMGLIDQSAVSAYLDKYYEEHPLDNSYEGILARYSGMTKDNVIALLDVMNYYNFIANYDASDRYAFGEPVVDKGDVLEFDNENVLAGGFILQNQILYADIRNRAFTV